MDHRKSVATYAKKRGYRKEKKYQGGEERRLGHQYRVLVHALLQWFRERISAYKKKSIVHVREADRQRGALEKRETRRRRGRRTT